MVLTDWQSTAGTGKRHQLRAVVDETASGLYWHLSQRLEKRRKE